MINALQAFYTLKKPNALAIAASAYAVIALCDYYTSVELSLTPLYLFNVLLVTWNCGVWWGLFFAALSVTTQTAFGLVLGHPYSHAIFFYVNSFNRMVSYCVVLGLTGQLRIMFDREQSMARIDSLTGALNQRSFYEALKSEIVRQARARRPVSVAFIDCDNFKEINDTYGHSEGDNVLCAIVRVFRRTLRTSDVIGRLGGDEFGVILVECDQAGAEKAAENLRRSIRQHLIAQGRDVKLSIGLGTFHSSAVSADQVLSLCDSLMYEAKSQGKDRIVLREYA